MNGRERLFSALNGEPSDRVPLWLLFPYDKTGYYADIRRLPRWKEVHEMSLRKAITLNRRNLGAPLFAPEVSISQQDFEENGAKVSRTAYEWRNVKLHSETRRSPGETTIKKLLESEDDLEAFCSLPLLASKDAIGRHLDAQMPQYLKEKEEFPDGIGAMMLDLGEPIGPLYHNANLEELAIWSLTRSELVESFLERAMEGKRIVYEYCLERNLAELYFMVGSELAAPPLVGIETFKRWIVPFAAELTEMIHGKNCKAIQHFHGKIKQILPYFLEMGADALHTIEAPPVGNCTMSEAYELVGDKIALIGNIQYDDFCRWSPERMREETEKLLRECQGRRLILSPTAGPFDPNPPELLMENCKAFMETAWNFKWR